MDKDEFKQWTEENVMEFFMEIWQEETTLEESTPKKKNSERGGKGSVKISNTVSSWHPGKFIFSCAIFTVFLFHFLPRGVKCYGTGLYITYVWKAGARKGLISSLAGAVLGLRQIPSTALCLPHSVYYTLSKTRLPKTRRSQNKTARQSCLRIRQRDRAV